MPKKGQNSDARRKMSYSTERQPLAGKQLHDYTTAEDELDTRSVDDDDPPGRKPTSQENAEILRKKNKHWKGARDQ